jgi:hypothetical protein
MADKSGGRRLGRIIRVDVSKHFGGLGKYDASTPGVGQWEHVSVETPPSRRCHFVGRRRSVRVRSVALLGDGWPRVVEPSEELAGGVLLLEEDEKRGTKKSHPGDQLLDITYCSGDTVLNRVMMLENTTST